MKQFYELRIIIREDGNEVAVLGFTKQFDKAPARTATIDEFFGTISFSEWYANEADVWKYADAINKEA